MDDQFKISKDRPVLQLMTACESGQHKLEPRYDFAKEGAVSIRTYVCEICTTCGHQVLPPFSLARQVEAGIVSVDEVRAALALLDAADIGLEHLPFAVRKIVAVSMQKVDGDGEG